MYTFMKFNSFKKRDYRNLTNIPEKSGKNSKSRKQIMYLHCVNADKFFQNCFENSRIS